MKFGKNRLGCSGSMILFSIKIIALYQLLRSYGFKSEKGQSGEGFAGSEFLDIIHYENGHV